ncbi:Rossmann-like and DUF2520 domain-containing protein [Flavitalea flava]
MNVVIIGSGNVATVLGGKMVIAGHRILQVISRRQEHAARLGEELSCPWSSNLAGINPAADLYLVAVSDQSLYLLAKELSLPGKLVVHTAGAVSKQVFLPVSLNSGVLYPLQSLRKEIRPFPVIPFLIDANEETDINVIAGFARSLSGQVRTADDAARLRLHLGGVIVNNFSNHLYTLTEDFCLRENLDFALLLPLISETAGRLSAGYHPGAVQTGPAIRGDKSTIAEHLKILDKYLDLKEIYNLFTIKIEEFITDKNLPDADVSD